MLLLTRFWRIYQGRYLICGLQLPREPHRSTRLLTGTLRQVEIIRRYTYTYIYRYALYIKIEEIYHQLLVLMSLHLALLHNPCQTLDATYIYTYIIEWAAVTISWNAWIFNIEEAKRNLKIKYHYIVSNASTLKAMNLSPSFFSSEK